MAKFVQVVIGIDGYDSYLSTWAWDVICLSKVSQPIWQFSKLASVTPHPLSQSFGRIILQNVPLDPGGFIAVKGVDLMTKKSFQPVANVSPVGAPQYFFLKARTAAGSVSQQSTVGQNRTGPTYTVSASEAAKLGLTIFGTGVESTTTVGGSRTSSSQTKTSQQQTTVTTPTDVVMGLELHRVMHMPDIAMLQPAANSDAFA